MEITLPFSLFSPNHGSFCDFYQFSSPRSDTEVQRCSAGYPELDKQAKVPGCGVRRLGSLVRTLTCRPHTGANEPLTSQPHLRKCDLADLKSLVDGFKKKKTQKVLGTAESGPRCHLILPS